jgi:hypothetical protein
MSGTVKRPADWPAPPPPDGVQADPAVPIRLDLTAEERLTLDNLSLQSTVLQLQLRLLQADADRILTQLLALRGVAAAAVPQYRYEPQQRALVRNGEATP